VCSKYCYKAKIDPYSSIQSLSHHRNCHPVCEVIFGIPCVCTVGLRYSHTMMGVDSSSLCCSTEKNVDFLGPNFDGGNR
jgi:hypothetical protein